MSNPLVAPTGVATVGMTPPNIQGVGGGVASGSPSVTGQFVVDGTPVRVATLGLAAALTILALRWAGFKFNVGVSS